jgi:hypothetical protein
MSRLLIADETLQKKLGTGSELVMICAPDGTVLGYFTPAAPQKLNLQPQISEEELRRREEDTNCKLYTTEEVIAKLRAL